MELGQRLTLRKNVVGTSSASITMCAAIPTSSPIAEVTFIAASAHWQSGAHLPAKNTRDGPCRGCAIKIPPPPDLTKLIGCKSIIEHAWPRYWIIECVRGAVPWFGMGPARCIVGPFYLWGHFPLFKVPKINHKKESFSGCDRAGRAAIPRELSEAVFAAIARNIK